MDMRTWPGRTYRFLQVPPLYPFGHGLSYTTFAYDINSVQAHAWCPTGGAPYKGNSGGERGVGDTSGGRDGDGFVSTSSGVSMGGGGGGMIGNRSGGVSCNSKYKQRLVRMTLVGVTWHGGEVKQEEGEGERKDDGQTQQTRQAQQAQQQQQQQQAQQQQDMLNSVGGLIQEEGRHRTLLHGQHGQQGGEGRRSTLAGMHVAWTVNVTVTNTGTCVCVLMMGWCLYMMRWCLCVL